MFNKLSVLISFIAISTLANAPDVKQPSKVRFGVLLGMGGSFFSENVEGFGGETGPEAAFKPFFRFTGTFGVTANYKVSKKFSTGFELMYAGRGMDYRAKNDAVTIVTSSGNEDAYNHYKYNINYLQVPLTANLILNPARRSEVSLYLGLAPEFLLSAKNKFTYWKSDGTATGAEEDDKTEKLKGVNSFNTELLAGLDVAARRRKSAEIYGLRFGYSLLPVFADSENQYGNLNTKNLTIALNLGLRF